MNSAEPVRVRRRERPGAGLGVDAAVPLAPCVLIVKRRWCRFSLSASVASRSPLITVPSLPEPLSVAADAGGIVHIVHSDAYHLIRSPASSSVTVTVN